MFLIISKAFLQFPTFYLQSLTVMNAVCSILFNICHSGSIHSIYLLRLYFDGRLTVGFNGSLFVFHGHTVLDLFCSCRGWCISGGGRGTCSVFGTGKSLDLHPLKHCLRSIRAPPTVTAMRRITPTPLPKPTGMVLLCIASVSVFCVLFPYSSVEALKRNSTSAVFFLFGSGMHTNEVSPRILSHCRLLPWLPDIFRHRVMEEVPAFLT